MSKLFDTAGWRKRHLKHRCHLEHLKTIIESQDETNALSLLNILLEEKKRRVKRKKSNVIIHWFKSVCGFIFKLSVVMGLLYTAALIFAYLEDEDTVPAKTFHNDTDNKVSSNASSLWLTLQREYDIELTYDDRVELRTRISESIRDLKIKKIDEATEHRNDIGHLKIQKWFYFIVIASTTIGYGDVCPKTQAGRIFYCFFSVIGRLVWDNLAYKYNCHVFFYHW